MDKMLFWLFAILLFGFSLGKGEEIYIRETFSEIIFGNSQVSLHFAKENGFLSALFSEQLNLQIVGHGSAFSPLDIQVEGKWLVEELALGEAAKEKGRVLEGNWKFALDPEDRGLREGWHKEEYDASGWDNLSLPASWEKLGYKQVFPDSPSPSWEPYNGYAFLRRKVSIPKEWEGEDLLLYIGAVDDFDWVYLNGELIGHTGEETPNWWETPRLYAVPKELVKFGEDNTFCLRIYDRGGEGGVRGPIFLVKKRDWEKLKTPFHLLGYEVQDEGNGKKFIIRSGVGDWVVESQYTLYPQSDVVLRKGKIAYKGNETPHISALRFTLSGVEVGEKEKCWYIIPSNFPPRRYRLEQEGRRVGGDYSGWNNRCVILRNDEMNLSFLALFYSETEDAGVYTREEKGGLDVVHTLYAADIMRERKELEGGTQIMRVVRGTLEETLKKEQEIYDIIGLTPPGDRPDWARKAIIYSAYPGGTMDSGLQDVGGFDNFARYLPHLSDIGFNVLWLLPVWPGLYGPTDYYKIEESLGGEIAAKRFVEKAHGLGLKVIFDLIPHGPREESGLLEKLPEAVSRDETGKVLYWWGCLSCDYASDAWQRYMAEHAAYWVRELGVDGYRVDCAGGGPANWDPRSPHRPTLSGLWGGLQILAKAREEMRKYKSEVMLLPEATGPWFFRYSDVVYDFPFMFICQNYSQYPREEWLSWFREWLEYEKYAYPKGATLMRFVESHDTVRFAGLNGNGTFNAFLALCALIEGAPMVYHDGDVGRGPFLKHLYHIRRANEELSLGEAHYLAVEADKKDVFGCLRVLGDKAAIIAINMSGREQDVELSLPQRFLPSYRDSHLYEAFEGKEVKGKIRDGKLVISLRIGAYSPAIILVRGEKLQEIEKGFSLPLERVANLKQGVVPTYREGDKEIVVENGIYKVMIDLRGGMLKHLSLKDGENWLERAEWEEGRRRLGIGEPLQVSKIMTIMESERRGEELFLRFKGEGEWADFMLEYRFDRSSRIDVKLRLLTKQDIRLMKGELWHWLKLKGVERWLVNTFEGIQYDDFLVRHFKEAVRGRYWHIPYLYEANRFPLNPYCPLLAAFRKDEYLALLLPPFYNSPENLYLRERMKEEGFHFVLALADGKRSWGIAPGESYETGYSLVVGRGSLPLPKEEEDEMPRVTCDGADYLIETSRYQARLSRRNGQVNSLGQIKASPLQGAEIYSDRGIYGEFYDSLGNAFSLLGTSNSDPEVEIKLERVKEKLLVATHSFLREGNSGWNNVARPLVEYQVRYEFSQASPYIKAEIMVKPSLEKEASAFLAQRLNFQGITDCLINGEEVSLSNTGRVWESRNYGIREANMVLLGEGKEVRLANVEIPQDGNLCIYNSGDGNITVFFAFMDGEAKIEPRWYAFSYEMGMFER